MTPPAATSIQRKISALAIGILTRYDQRYPEECEPDCNARNKQHQ